MADIYLGGTDLASADLKIGSTDVDKAYLGSTEVWSSAPAFDADAQAFITATGITGTDATAVNTLVVDLKAANIWTLFDAIYPMVGGTATTCKYNLKDPQDTDAAHRIVFNNSWTFSSTGADPTGNAWADCNYIVNANNMTQNSNHLSYYVRTTGQGVCIGHNYGTRMWFTPNYNGNVGYAPQQTNSATQIQRTSLPTDMRKFWVSSRIASNQSKFFANGTLETTLNNGSSGLQPAGIILNDRSTNNSSPPSPNGNYFGGECAFASMGQGLSDAQVSSFSTAVIDFQTTLGRVI
jgi:hypothetical protein